MRDELQPTLFDRVMVWIGWQLPWCAPDQHTWLEVHGDGRNTVGARWICADCPARKGRI